jgi:hypothetical protein
MNERLRLLDNDLTFLTLIERLRTSNPSFSQLDRKVNKHYNAETKLLLHFSTSPFKEGFKLSQRAFTLLIKSTRWVFGEKPLELLP